MAMTVTVIAVAVELAIFIGTSYVITMMFPMVFKGL